ncbi:hypothetical protein [Frigidibacter sp. ROC022]|uniref:hypothetical protein n=1 Tax=Frigidibacter sp. ROC022 TaxID=2971796 RepID=UPI00215AF751|nr:hypothetical protein [Frigidibacter sp. ROC022]MCR8723025.1 hypothetical protein [Frigidibacter sp. ROC022]
MTATKQVGTGLKIGAGVAIAFGALTLFSGGMALFGGAEVQAAVGNAVPWVLWFNFLSGAVYIAAGIGIWTGAIWGTVLARLLAVSLLALFAAFLWRVYSGGAYEMRTVGAMVLRSGFWLGMAVALGRCRLHQPAH